MGRHHAASAQGKRSHLYVWLASHFPEFQRPPLNTRPGQCRQHETRGHKSALFAYTRQTSVESVQDAGAPTQCPWLGFRCLQTCPSGPRKADSAVWSIPYLKTNVVGSLPSDHSAAGLWTLFPSSQDYDAMITRATLTSGSSNSHTYNILSASLGPV